MSINKKVLLVDEEDWYMEPILDRLDYEEIEHEYCQTVADSLEVLKSEITFALAVLDMRMPFGADFGIAAYNALAPGLFLFDKIREKTDIPIICYTATNNQEVIDAIYQRKGIYISKASGHAYELISEIKRLLPNQT